LWSSKDITSIIVLAVLGLVSTGLIGQMAGLISGIRGANYVFTIIFAIQTSLSFLIYEGRRWRFFLQFTIFTLLIIPTYLGGPPFSVQSKIHFIIAAFIADILLNSVYNMSRKRNMLKLWSVLGAVMLWMMIPFLSLLIRPLFYSPEAVSLFADIVLLLLPVIIIESIVGGYLGYRIYQRVSKLQATKTPSENASKTKTTLVNNT
jgi:hypothetical protein